MSTIPQIEPNMCIKWVCWKVKQLLTSNTLTSFQFKILRCGHYMRCGHYTAHATQLNYYKKWLWSRLFISICLYPAYVQPRRQNCQKQFYFCVMFYEKRVRCGHYRFLAGYVMPTHGIISMSEHIAVPPKKHISEDPYDLGDQFAHHIKLHK